MALVGFQYEPVSVELNEVCFDEKQETSLIACEKSRKNIKVLLNGVDVGNVE